MRFLSRAAAALLIGVAAPAFVAPGFAQTCVCPPAEGGVAVSGPVIQAPEPPPPAPEYEQPAMPAPGYHWTPGYWAWNNVDYYWVPGAWVEPPRVGVLWTPPYWGYVAGVFVFHRGYWAPHVGFYGGINYGFGYGGTGYEGGRWENGQFYYNRAVNNFGATPVTRVYDQPITVNNTTINRVSYNGGPGGLQLKPTPEQEQVAAQPHVPPTSAQLTQVRAASVNAEQFRAANQGRPAVAATPRPGDFTGPGVVPAKAAGAVQTLPAAGQTVPPKTEERLAPGGKPLPGVATPPGGKPLPGVRAPAAGQTAPVGTPLTGQAPNGSEKLPAAEKPPAGAKAPGGPARENLKEKPPAGPPAGAPKAQEKPQRLETPQGLAKPPLGEKPAARAMSGAPRPEIGQPRPALAPKAEPKGPPAAAARKPEPGGRARECGRPGLPACPK